MAVIGVEHEVPEFVPNSERIGYWARRRARIQAVREAALAESHAELRVIEESGVIERLVDLALSRPEEYQIGVSEPQAGKRMTVVMRSDIEYHLFPIKAKWCPGTLDTVHSFLLVF